MPTKKDFLKMTPAERQEYLENASPQEIAQVREGVAMLKRQGKIGNAAEIGREIEGALTAYDNKVQADRTAATGRREEAFSASQAKVAAEATKAQAANKAGIKNANAAGSTWAPEGIDQTNKGVGEQLWGLKEKDFFAPTEGQQFTEANRGTYGQAGFGEQRARSASDQLATGGPGEDYWQGVQGKYNEGGPGYVQEAYKSFDADVDPNLGGYYDHAFNQAAGGINKQLAARGQFGSSAGMQQLGNVAVGLNAERANREAAYGLDRFRTKMGAAGAASTDEQSWVQGMGDIAFRADDARRGRINDSAAQAASAQGQQFDRLGQAYGQAATNDQQVASNRNAGFSAAFGAQDRRDNRIQQGFDNQIGFGAVLAGMGQNRINNEFGAATAGAEAGLGAATDSYNATTAAQERQYNEYLSTYKGAAEAAASFAPQKPKPKKVT